MAVCLCLFELKRLEVIGKYIFRLFAGMLQEMQRKVELIPCLT